MSAIDIVKAILLADGAVSAVVADRFWPVQAPQEAPRPCIVLHTVSKADGRNLSGSDLYPLARVIVDSIADSYSDADDLGEVVEAALRDFRGTVGTFQVDDIACEDLDVFDRGERGDRWRRRLGFAVRYRAAA